MRSAGTVGPLRCNLEPVEMKRSGRGAWFTWAEGGRSVVWHSGDLCRNLAAVLERRVMDAGRAGLKGLPLEARYCANLSDIVEFLEDRTDDRRIEELLWGAALIRRDAKWPRPSGAPLSLTPLPRTYAILKLLFLPPSEALKSKSDGKPIRPEPGILARLRSGDVNGACGIAARRLRVSGYSPMPGPTSGGGGRPMEFGAGVVPSRLAAALLVPVWDVESLSRLVLRREREEARVGR
jgi:CRISPR-associated protein Csx17